VPEILFREGKVEGRNCLIVRASKPRGRSWLRPPASRRGISYEGGIPWRKSERSSTVRILICLTSSLIVACSHSFCSFRKILWKTTIVGLAHHRRPHQECSARPQSP